MTEELSPVRIATAIDRPEVFRLLVQGHEENGMFPWDPERLDWWLTRMLQPELLSPLDADPRGVIGVIGGSEHLEALAFLVIGRLWYSTQRHLEEFIVYVDPVHRHSTHHKSLIEWMKNQSRLTGLRLMTGILSLRPRTEAKVRLYQRYLPKAGAFFYFDPVTQNSSAVEMVH